MGCAEAPCQGCGWLGARWLAPQQHILHVRSRARRGSARRLSLVFDRFYRSYRSCALSSHGCRQLIIYSWFNEITSCRKTAEVEMWMLRAWRAGIPHFLLFEEFHLMCQKKKALFVVLAYIEFTVTGAIIHICQ